MDAALLRRVEQQRIEMLYDNTLAVSGSALLMTALIAVIAWPHTQVTNIVAWAGAALLVQASVLALSAAYRRASDRDNASRRWGWRLAAAAGVAGIVWGSAAFVLVGPDKSLTLGLISACLAGRATLSIVTHAHFPPALHAFTVPIFGLLALRYVTLGGYGNAALGVMWIAVLGYVLLFVDRQSRAVVAQIRLRYENEQLVEQLQRQNTLAEQARARAEEASRSKSSFFAAANHDLRQPLHSLGLFATALRNNSAGRSSQALVDQILQCTESLEQLFDNLLDISKLDAGQVEVKREIVSVDTVFDRVRSTFSGPAQDKGLRLTVRRSKATLGTDATLLFRVLVESGIELAALHGERRRPRCLPAARQRRQGRGVGYRHRHPARAARAHLRGVLSAQQSGARPLARIGPGPRDRPPHRPAARPPAVAALDRRQGLAFHDRSADRRSVARAIRRGRRSSRRCRT